MSSASRRRDNSTPIWRAAFKNAAHRSGFSRESPSRHRRPSEAMERLKQRSGPAPADDGPTSSLSLRLPRAMKETGRSSASRPREPSAPGPRGAKGPQGHVNSGPTSRCNAKRERPSDKPSKDAQSARRPGRLPSAAAADAVSQCP